MGQFQRMNKLCFVILSQPLRMTSDPHGPLKRSETNADMLADSANFALTVSSDGWRDFGKNSVQNFLVNSPGGSYYVKSSVFYTTKDIDRINTWLDSTIKSLQVQKHVRFLVMDGVGKDEEHPQGVRLPG